MVLLADLITIYITIMYVIILCELAPFPVSATSHIVFL